MNLTLPAVWRPCLAEGPRQRILFHYMQSQGEIQEEGLNYASYGMRKFILRSDAWMLDNSLRWIMILREAALKPDLGQSGATRGPGNFKPRGVLK